MRSLHEALATGPAGIERVPLAAAAGELLASLEAQPWGQVSPSVYETARLVALAPWLAGHAARQRFLARTQRPDGRWGQNGRSGTGAGYDLVPTLSATEAAMSVAERTGATDATLMAERGLDALHRLLASSPAPALPDTPAIEIIVPALVGAINARLARDAAPAGAGRWRGLAQLSHPPGSDPDLLATIRAALRSGAALPAKLLHSLEVAAPLPRAARALTPQPAWTVGASPAATAAWLGHRPGRHPKAVNYLARVADRHGGAVPSVIPITAFECAWVLTTLADAGIALPHQPRVRLIAQLAAGLGPQGTAGGAGLPPDGDTTSVTLLAIEQVGGEPELDLLLGYQSDTHFLTWALERTPSVSTNAHVLDALGTRLRRRPEQHTRYGAARDRVVGWLCDQQAVDGSWRDKWHASQFYATGGCLLALARFGGHTPGAPAAVTRAVGWLLASQRCDGGWGRWDSTREETAYAVRALVGVPAGIATANVAPALARGHAYLRRSIAAGDDPPLWHDKDLYVPLAVVRACVLGALAARQPGRPAQVPRPRRGSTVEDDDRHTSLHG